MSLQDMQGAIVNPDEVIKAVTNDGDGGLWAKAASWVEEYGAGFKFEFEVVDAAWFEKQKFESDQKEFVISAEIVNESEDTFLIDIKARNRGRIAKSLGLENPTASELLGAIIGSKVEITAEYFKQFGKYGFVIDIARQASATMKPKQAPAQPPATATRNPRRV